MHGDVVMVNMGETVNLNPAKDRGAWFNVDHIVGLGREEDGRARLVTTQAVEVLDINQSEAALRLQFAGVQFVADYPFPNEEEQRE